MTKRLSENHGYGVLIALFSWIILETKGKWQNALDSLLGGNELVYLFFSTGVAIALGIIAYGASRKMASSEQNLPSKVQVNRR